MTEQDEEKERLEGLAAFALYPTSEPEAARMALEDATGRRMELLVSPDGLREILTQSLRLAEFWAHLPDLQIADWSGPRRALTGTHVAINAGRNETESVLRVFLGKVELTFVVPLDTLVNAAADLATQLDPDSGRPAH